MTYAILSRWWRWLATVVIVAAIAGYGAAQWAGQRARDGVLAAAHTDAQLRVALLDSEIARFRLLPRALADDRDVVATLRGDPAAQALNVKFERLAQAIGASTVYLVGPDGVTLAASNWREPESFVGSDYRFRGYFGEARARGEASQFALGTVSRRAGLYLARRTAGGGVLVVKLEFDRIEAAWRRAGGTTIVRDSRGVVLVTSRPDWRFATSRPLDAATIETVRRDAGLAHGDLPLLPAAARRTVEVALPVVGRSGWTLVLRRSAAPAILATQRNAAIGAVLATLILAALIWGLRQRAALTQRRTAGLEAAVAERTAALTREIEERTASEARAAELREGLRQANRLATLGQVTASVAHETAQPVAAIRTYAQTSTMLLDRGDHDAVRANLATIQRLSDRIGAVTDQLRGFARRRPGEIRALPLAEIVDGALLILKDQLRSVTLDIAPVAPDLMVLGGRVRLEQVLVNLLQNAGEALADRQNPRIAITIAADAERVRLRVADNGPGIAADVAERLFTPFVTSRANGLGLGLVIAGDIMADLGGTLRLLPSATGAWFELELRRA